VYRPSAKSGCGCACCQGLPRREPKLRRAIRPQYKLEQFVSRLQADEVLERPMLGHSRAGLRGTSSHIEMTLALVIPPAGTQVERWLSHLPPPISVKADVPNFYPGALLTGDNAPLKVTAGAL
jgi:hypothetical protein